MATGTSSARKFLPPQTERANNFKSETFGLRPEAAYLRRLPAPWTVHAVWKLCGIRLQQRAGEELKSGKVAGRIPIVCNEPAEIGWSQRSRCVREQARRCANGEIEQRWKKSTQPLQVSGRDPALPIRKPRIENQDSARRGITFRENARAVCALLKHQRRISRYHFG